MATVYVLLLLKWPALTKASFHLNVENEQNREANNF